MLWMNRTPISFIGVILSALSVSVSQDPCLDGNAMTLDHMTKRSSSYAMDSAPLCDRYITETWYRPLGYVMTTSPPSLTFCGTLYPVWMSEPFPPDGVNKTLTACEVGFNNTCQRRHKVDVKNCTDFLVYKLKALDVCNSAYCFELQDDCINQTVSNVKVSFHNITWKRLEQDGQQGLVQHDPSINLLCSFTPSADDTLLYHIDWYVDNDTVIQGQTVSKSSLDNATLSAEDMNNAGKKINSWIHCVVGIKRPNAKYPCLSIPSDVFFAGIEILNHTLTIERKGKARLMIRPTIPFASETIETRNGQQITSPLNIQLSFPEDAKCKQQSSGNLQECSVSIDSFTHNNRHLYENPTNWNKVYDIDVFNTDDGGYKLPEHNLRLRLEANEASGTGAKIFAKAAFHDVLIKVVDSEDGWKGKCCMAHGDPRYRTFDGYWYSCQLIGCAAGQAYLLYKNANFSQEVQVKHEECYGASCVCALAFRAGLDVFMIDFCNGREFISFLVCMEDSLKVIKEWDMTYKIIFPTGTFVRATIQKTSTDLRIFTDVYPSVADISRTSGLCGYLDSNIANDLRLRDGSEDNINFFTRSNPPDEFSLSWRISDRSTENLLSYSWFVYDQLESLSSTFHKLCTCEEKQTRCSYKKYKECKTVTKGKEYHCRLHSSRRKKRDVFHISNIQRNIRKTQNGARFKRQAYTEKEAFEICSETFQNSEFFMACLQVVPNFNNETLVNCRDDLLLSGYRGFVQWHLDAALEQCQTYVQLNSSFQIDNAYVSTNIVDLCPKNCSDKGLCLKGNCTCEKGYGGSDCSFDVSSPPTITKLSDDGICDKSEETCEDITLYGHYFLENMETQCFMTREEVNEHSFVMSTTSYTVRLEESTLYEGYCSLQYNSDTSWITLFHLRLSKDATQFSETYTVYVYQSECQTFHNNSGVITFTLQSGYCFIKGTCIRSGMTHVNQSCWRCSPQMDAYDWTWVCDSEGTTNSSVVRTTEITETHSAVTETNENHVKRNSADDSQQSDLETVGLSVAVAFIALITFATVGIVIKIRMSGHNSKTLNIYTNESYGVFKEPDDISCIATKGKFHSAE